MRPDGLLGLAPWKGCSATGCAHRGLVARSFARPSRAAEANPWRALTLEWQVTSPPPIFNFDAVPTVVGGPYEYGVPGAVHGVLKGAEVPTPAGATASGTGGATHTAVKDEE